MPWDDRLREAAYTSPSGVRLTFQYENVSRKVDKKTTGFDFPDADGTYVQDLGHTGRRYPLKAIFWGDDYDLDAEAFEDALLESGKGKLEHPAYGVSDVVPFGTITRRDDLKTGANQAVIEFTLWDTIGLAYPVVQDDPSSMVLSAVEGYNSALALEFEDTVSLKNAVDAAAFKNDYQVLLNSTSIGLDGIAEAQEDVQKQFDAVVDSINQGIDILISQPLTLAFQTSIMIQSPARALTNIRERLEAYKSLTNNIIKGDDSIIAPSIGVESANKFRNDNLYVSTYVTGSIISVINNQFATKTEALLAAEGVLTQLEDVTSWRDDNFKSVGEVDTGGSYQKLQEAVALTAGFLVEISFTLKQERRVTLTRNRTIIDLVAEFYNSVDDQLDFFITSNDLSGSEILEVPKGREIVYYV